MADSSRGHGGPAETNNETGLADVLSAFAVYGGQLAGARRWADNPLTLTHVRWHGPSGQYLDAIRRPGDESWMTTGEREAWVQLALHYPAEGAPMASGPASPWVPLAVAPEQGRALSSAIGRSRPANSAVWSRPQGSGMQSAPRSMPGPSASFEASQPFWQTPQPPSWQSDPSTTRGRSASSDPWTQPRQSTGGWSFNRPEEQVVIPCVEIELPSATPGLATADFARDYARDVAVHFARAARTLPQVRELRAWMRNERLILAARMVLATNGRAPTRADMEGAAQLLADVLAQRTIPFIRMTFADQDEWQNAAQMPE